MRQRIILILALALAPQLAAQSDSAAVNLVERYLGILNIDALPHDSMLVINTIVTYPGTTDTFTMQRYYTWPQMFRVDVFDSKGNREVGYCTNGSTRYRSFDKDQGWWREINPRSFWNMMTSYDFRGPLYNWRTEAVDLTYMGTTTAKEQQLEVVKVSGPETMTRLYMFEESGLLAVIMETGEVEGEAVPKQENVIDWICQHEYQQLGATVLPSLESFARGNKLTVLQSEASLEPLNNLIFNKD